MLLPALGQKPLHSLSLFHLLQSRHRWARLQVWKYSLHALLETQDRRSCWAFSSRVNCPLLRHPCGVWKYFFLKFVLLSESWSGKMWLQDFTLTEILLPCSSLALEDHHPPSAKTLLLPSFFLLSFHFFLFLSTTWILFPQLKLSQSLLYLFLLVFERSWHPTHSIYHCHSLTQWHMGFVNSWAAGQPQIRYEHTAHEAQLFKRLSLIAHTSYTTSQTAEVLSNQTSSVCFVATWTIICY